MNAKATLYLDPQVYRAVKVRAAQQDRSISDLVNEVLKRELAGPSQQAKSTSKPYLALEGPMGLPVIHNSGWPKGRAFNREDLYD